MTPPVLRIPEPVNGPIGTDMVSFMSFAPLRPGDYIVIGRWDLRIVLEQFDDGVTAFRAPVDERLRWAFQEASRGLREAMRDRIVLAVPTCTLWVDMVIADAWHFRFYRPWQISRTEYQQARARRERA